MGETPGPLREPARAGGLSSPKKKNKESRPPRRGGAPRRQTEPEPDPFPPPRSTGADSAGQVGFVECQPHPP